MANLTTKNAKELGRIKTSVVVATGAERTTYTYLWVVRTDGKVLRRLTGEIQTGYTIFGRLANIPASQSEARGVLARIATKRGHTVVA